MSGKLIEITKSLCPECFSVIDARVFEEDGKILMEKECPEHGRFLDVYWGDAEIFRKARRFKFDGKGIDNPITKVARGCPFDCGLCPNHLSHTVLANIDVTNRCNLACPTCFANAAVSGYVYEPDIEEIEKMLRVLRNERPVPAPALQYSGGEPTVRDDIVDLVKLAYDLGFRHVQIATNGILLAKNPQLAKELAEENLKVAYLQFDGVTPEPYLKLRGRDILKIKLQAIENCRKAGLGVVLVPTLVRGVNDHQVGDIIRFAVKNMDIIRGVNFQPVAFTGRVSEDRIAGRITLPDLAKLIEEQTNGEIRASDFYPVPTVVPVSYFVEALENREQVEFTAHPNCGLATYVFVEDERMIPITRFVDVDGFVDLLLDLSREAGKAFGKARVIAKLVRNLSKLIRDEECPKSINVRRLLLNFFLRRDYKSLGEIHHSSLFIGAMHFQDPYNLDLERVRRCVIHYATPDGRIIPFCTYNTIHRERVERMFSMTLEEWQRRREARACMKQPATS